MLQLLYSAGAMSRADLARGLGMSKVTVSDLVGELIESGHAVELGPSDEVRPGKPATLVDVNRTGLQTIGLDLAEHETLRGAVLDLDGNILVRAERAIGDATGQAVAAYRFHSRPASITARVKRIEPVVKAFDQVAVRLEESRLVVTHALELNVERAGI